MCEVIPAMVAAARNPGTRACLSWYQRYLPEPAQPSAILVQGWQRSRPSAAHDRARHGSRTERTGRCAGASSAPSCAAAGSASSPSRSACARSRRRRTPGLRREEVAQLAGVGVTWYTWLEQGRDINPSRAGARRDREDAAVRRPRARPPVHARRHRDDHDRRTSASALCPTVQPLIDQLEPFPAMVVNARLDLLAYNRVYASFFDDLDTIPIEDRNMLWLVFTHPQWRASDRRLGRHRRPHGRRVPRRDGRAPRRSRLEDARRPSAPRLARVRRHLGAPRRPGRRGPDEAGAPPQVGLLRLVYTNLWLGQRAWHPHRRVHAGRRAHAPAARRRCTRHFALPRLGSSRPSFSPGSRPRPTDPGARPGGRAEPHDAGARVGDSAAARPCPATSRRQRSVRRELPGRRLSASSVSKIALSSCRARACSTGTTISMRWSRLRGIRSALPSR